MCLFSETIQLHSAHTLTELREKEARGLSVNIHPHRCMCNIMLMILKSFEEIFYACDDKKNWLISR